MNENIVIFIVSILGVVSFFYLKSQGIHHDIQIKGSRMTIKRYETKYTANPNHPLIKAKSLQYVIGSTLNKPWSSMFLTNKQKEVSELLSRPKTTVGLLPGDSSHSFITVTLETAQSLLPYITKETEDKVIDFAEKWGDVFILNSNS